MDSEIRKVADKLIGRIEQLHSAPQIAQKILHLTRHPDFDLGAVTACLENDPAMTARILRVVNSSRYGLQQKVTSVRHAAAFIGQRSLRLITLTFGLVDGLTRGVAANLYHEYWKRALTMATAASRFASVKNGVSPEDAYTGGMLADMGVLVFAQIFGEKYASLYESAEHGPALIDLEREMIGCDHTSLGSRLLNHWELPEPLPTAVLYHHERREEASPLETSIYVGDVVSDALWRPDTARPAAARALLQTHLGYSIDEVIAFGTACAEELSGNAQEFEIELNESIDLERFSEEVRSQESQEGVQEQEAEEQTDEPSFAENPT